MAQPTEHWAIIEWKRASLFFLPAVKWTCCLGDTINVIFIHFIFALAKLFFIYFPLILIQILKSLSLRLLLCQREPSSPFDLILISNSMFNSNFLVWFSQFTHSLAILLDDYSFFFLSKFRILSRVCTLYFAHPSIVANWTRPTHPSCVQSSYWNNQKKSIFFSLLIYFWKK